MLRKLQSIGLFVGPLLLLGWAVLVNPVTLGTLFTSDGQIDSDRGRLVLWLAAAALGVAAVLTILLRKTLLRAWLAAGQWLLMLATPALLWAYWHANPNRHHWHRSLSPREAVARMQVPEGFSVELVAAEPDIVNPVAMAFDERGRIWLVESIEYPRLEPGPGRDRIKILEDTDSGGRADKITVFAGGLNLPTGIAVGGGGVWVFNAPDLLLLRDTDGDDRADEREVILTGFGRNDAHEFPNSLTWGPDGWLYGLNGIANPSRIEQNGREFRFSCAVFRIHPRTREFQLFAEGTSNPWGIAWDRQGSAFISACVIDHLWHIAESGYYQNQSNYYRPHTWPMRSIVEHKHQAAAYCGLEYYDSDAYPPEYRERLYMGNIHGSCLNVDRLERRGATYFARPEADFLTARDGWFMPVAVKTGPDGSLYVLDWYDRYHCYQDAERDPAGVDRLKGRLYRIRYRDTPRRGSFNLAEESGSRLIERLADGSSFFRRTARRLLAERLAETNDKQARAKLESLVFDEARPRRQRLHALEALVGSGRLTPSFHSRLLAAEDHLLQVWGVRAAADCAAVSPEIVQQATALAKSSHPAVQLEVAVAAAKQPSVDTVPVLVDVLRHSSADALLPRIVWQNLLPLLETHSEQFFREAEDVDPALAPNLAPIVDRAMQRVLDDEEGGGKRIDVLVRMLNKKQQPELVRGSLRQLAVAIQVGQWSPSEEIAARLQPALDSIVQQPSHPLWLDAAILAAGLGDETALASMRRVAASPQQANPDRVRAIRMMIAVDGERALPLVESVLREALAEAKPDFAGRLLDALGRLQAPAVAEFVIALYPELPAELQTQAVDLLTSRLAWGRKLLASIENGAISRDAVHVEHIRKLSALPDEEFRRQVERQLGSVRATRDPHRARVIARMRQLLETSKKGGVERGRQVFARACASCHKIYGQGHNVGPDLTSNGRSNLEQLLSNVFDPNLVVGSAYQTRMIVTEDGRVLTGLLVEDSKHRVVLKLPGGKREAIPRDTIDELVERPISLMPEGIEKQLSDREIVDLFAFLLENPSSGR